MGIPFLCVMVRYAAGIIFKAKFTLSAKVGFCGKLQGWPIRGPTDEPVVFQGDIWKAESVDLLFDLLKIVLYEAGIL